MNNYIQINLIDSNKVLSGFYIHYSQLEHINKFIANEQGTFHSMHSVDKLEEGQLIVAMDPWDEIVLLTEEEAEELLD